MPLSLSRVCAASIKAWAPSKTKAKCDLPFFAFFHKSEKSTSDSFRLANAGTNVGLSSKPSGVK